MKPQLTIKQLCNEAGSFAAQESLHQDPIIYGTTDGKAIGTYLEHKFRAQLAGKYTFGMGSSAQGIDFPELNVDMKVTRITQPQSSCPFESARQKIYGLGYAVLVFVYDKHDDPQTQTGRLEILNTIFIEAPYTADYQTTRGILQILENDGNNEELVAFMRDRNLPVDDIQAYQLAEEILRNPPQIGYITICNPQLWRAEYCHESAENVTGVVRIRQK